MQKNPSTQKIKEPLFLLILTIMFTFSFPGKALAEGEDPLTPNPIAEGWVLEQIALGEIADLEQHFSNRSDRVLSVDFLEKLLEGKSGINITRQGVRIRNAIFVEPLEMENIEVLHDLWLEYCEFKNDVDMSEGHFHKDVSFYKSRFDSRVDFFELTVDGTLSLAYSVFSGGVDFVSAEIGSRLWADDAQFESEGEADFNSMQVEDSIFLNKAVFSGPVDFGYVNVGRNFDADDAQFTSTEEANFNTMKVMHTVFLRQAVFSGGVDFISAEVGSLWADDAQFESEEEGNFNGMKVEDSIFFNRAVFSGPVDFGYVNVGRNFVADDAQFESTEVANFNSMKVMHTVFLRRAVFSGGVDFISAEIGSQLWADDAQFESTEVANFNSMKVMHTVFLRRAVFSGGVDFIGAEIGSQLWADDAQFESEGEADFNSMQVEDSIFLNKAVFSGPVDFRYMRIGRDFNGENVQFTKSTGNISFAYTIVGNGISLEDSTFNEEIIFDDTDMFDLSLSSGETVSVHTRLSLERAIIRRKLEMKNITLADLAAEALQVRGTAYFANVSIEDNANLAKSSFSNLIFENSLFPSTEDGLTTEGMDYQHFQIINDEESDWESLLAFVNQSTYSAQTYTALENYFLEQGYPDRANQVFIAYKRRERSESTSWRWNLFLEIFILYGRSPGRAFLWSFLIIMIGYWVFYDEKGMVSQQEKGARKDFRILGNINRRRFAQRRLARQKQSQYYSPFWYSLDTFLPFVNLGMAAQWYPKPDRRFARFYQYVHILLGWILIPIALLAVSGLIN